MALKSSSMDASRSRKDKSELRHRSRGIGVKGWTYEWPDEVSRVHVAIIYGV